jgi:hypothetical protein
MVVMVVMYMQRQGVCVKGRSRESEREANSQSALTPPPPSTQTPKHPNTPAHTPLPCTCQPPGYLHDARGVGPGRVPPLAGC